MFKGAVEVGASTDVGDVSCESWDWTTVRGGWLGQPAILFAKRPAPEGSRLRPLRDPHGKWSAWLFLGSAEDQRQVEQVLEELSSYEANTEQHAATIRRWLQSPNQHLRGLGVARAQQSRSEEFVEDLLDVLGSGGSDLSVRAGARAALQDVLNRRNGTPHRYDPDDPLYDRLVEVHVRLASDPPGGGDAAARTAVNAIRFLAQRRSAIEGVWYNLDGSTGGQFGGAGIRCDPRESPAECDARWYSKHGSAAAAFWSEWYAGGGHLKAQR